ncbi:hypothetical protein CALVIDRAFT_540490 [Calocera viscosa TUFC12733]|uniref:Uncharacterized protein n=1 Tax=Calocera viscosa (strain TUFC12733) TaxID=1330018 RepID=A0A167IW92_CALVF|nr:hypothetical protein CALVIDRAFT_540490 [Calocera viscosa TUFC12733]
MALLQYLGYSICVLDDSLTCEFWKSESHRLLCGRPPRGRPTLLHYCTRSPHLHNGDVHRLEFCDSGASCTTRGGIADDSANAPEAHNRGGSKVRPCPHSHKSPAPFSLPLSSSPSSSTCRSARPPRTTPPPPSLLPPPPPLLPRRSTSSRITLAHKNGP